MKLWVSALASGAVLLGLSACDNGPSAVASTPPPQGAQRLADAGAAPAPAAARGAREDHRDDPAPLVDGRPMWSASRDRTAEENAQRAFERNGADFGARDVDAFVKTAHAFVSDPPAGAKTLTRANGDVLIYDPKANVFAVRTREGAPRTLFKPDDGPAYWAQQQDRESRRTAGRDRREREG
ncbi:MAG: hypothetical protein ABW042_09600 [Phenylobacterium sp.]